MIKYDPIQLDEIKTAQERIKMDSLRTPLLKLNVDNSPAEIYLKLENLQPIRSFKIRPASNALRQLTKNQLEQGVWTVSSGNFSQGLAFMAKKLGIKSTIVLSENTPQTKIEKTEKLGAKVVKLTGDKVYETYFSRQCDGVEGTFVHPSNDRIVMTGNGTIGLEIMEDMPDVDAVLVPWGIGGMACGVASAVKAINPEVKFIVCEAEDDVKFGGISKEEGVVDPKKQRMFREIFVLAKDLVDDNITISLDEAREAVRLLVERNCVVSEVQGAYSVAAALSGKAGDGKVACLISGGNIDLDELIPILK